MVEQIWRHPVKSTGGERLRQVDVDERGQGSMRIGDAVTLL